MAEVNRRKGTNTSAADTQNRIDTLEKEAKKLTASETELLMLKINGQASAEAFASASGLLKTKRGYLEEELSRQRAALSALADTQAAIDALVALRETLVKHLDTAEPEERRRLLLLLDTRVIFKGQDVEISLGYGGDVAEIGDPSVRKPQAM